MESNKTKNQINRLKKLIEINSNGKQAFNYFNTHGIRKRWTLMRPIMRANGYPHITCGVDVDFADTFITSDITVTPTNYAAWDTAIWDSSSWGGDLNVLSSWQGIFGTGNCCAIRIMSVSNGIQLRWDSTDIVYETGGIL